jgi:hypothetical protein
MQWPRIIKSQDEDFYKLRTVATEDTNKNTSKASVRTDRIFCLDPW